MDVVLEAGLLAQRRAVPVGEEHGRRGGVDADPDDVGRLDAGRPDGRGDGPAQHLDVVAGVLERELGRQRAAVARRESGVHDTVRVLGDVGAELFAGRGVHDDGATGQGAEIDAEDVRATAHRSLLVLVDPARAAVPGIPIPTERRPWRRRRGPTGRPGIGSCIVGPPS